MLEKLIDEEESVLIVPGNLNLLVLVDAAVFAVTIYYEEF